MLSNLHQNSSTPAASRPGAALPSVPAYLPALLPGGLAPRSLADRFCSCCLAITEHDSAAAPRPYCLLCDTRYSAKPPESVHGAALWQLAQAEMKQMKKNYPVLTGYLIPAGGAFGVDLAADLRVVPISSAANYSSAE